MSANTSPEAANRIPAPHSGSSSWAAILMPTALPPASTTISRNAPSVTRSGRWALRAVGSSAATGRLLPRGSEAGDAILDHLLVRGEADAEPSRHLHHRAGEHQHPVAGQDVRERPRVQGRGPGPAVKRPRGPGGRPMQ